MIMLGGAARARLARQAVNRRKSMGKSTQKNEKYVIIST
jgi:hypothetical protein